jgi:serine/threonine protein kinase
MEGNKMTGENWMNSAEEIAADILMAVKYGGKSDNKPRFNIQSIREIGDGSSANVFKVEDLSLGGREVAVKVWKENDEDAIKRYKKESDILAKMDHPHIVTIHGFDIVHGRPIIIMERAREHVGKQLDPISGKFDYAKILDVMTQLKGAIAHLHNKDTRHNDIKPSNILVFRSAEGDTYKLAELGSGKKEGSSGSTTMSHLQFRAPEMFPGVDEGDWCAATDIYALAVNIISMRSGRENTPIRHPDACQNLLYNAKKSGLVDIVGREIDHAGVRSVMLRAMDPSCSKRYHQVEEFVDDLTRVIGDVKPSSSAPRKTATAQKFESTYGSLEKALVKPRKSPYGTTVPEYLLKIIGLHGDLLDLANREGLLRGGYAKMMSDARHRLIELCNSDIAPIKRFVDVISLPSESRRTAELQKSGWANLKTVGDYFVEVIDSWRNFKDYHPDSKDIFSSKGR